MSSSSPVHSPIPRAPRFFSPTPSSIGELEVSPIHLPSAATPPATIRKAHSRQQSAVPSLAGNCKSSRGRMAEDNNSSMGNKVAHKNDQPCELSHKYIKQITNDFDEGLIVGTGGFGTVYKGICENGEEIAVKVLKNMSRFDSKEFQKEFENLRRLNHQNVVKLVGFCNETNKVVAEYKGKQVIAEEIHMALCFEYVRNGSLAKYMSDGECSGLNWYVQYKIIKGICEGLEYLRHGLEVLVWHLDLKPDNILLDNNMIPKITDFGLSRLLGDEKTRQTRNSMGTRGYMPPEYLEHGIISREFDIFSLGVIIAKLMAGSEAYSQIDGMTNARFIKHVQDNWRKKLRETLAPRLVGVYCKQVKICIQIALKCMKRDRHERPTIKSILSNLVETETEIMTANLGLQARSLRPRTARGKARALGDECHVCGLEFSTGQALGGHMRRHKGPSVGKARAQGNDT